MYLKQIEMTGFKSFADRTKISFTEGVTAIVGPNGSGKSNVTESLRWALGEQSAKSLRGSKMPDIIFSGTEARRAMNFAEVTVTFDNSDSYLNSQEEVTVTRRLYRNGDSDFLINNKKVRLKDIHDLFTDTGLGRDSFSIISQGKIESIFNSRPEERRLIFEEAAGVLKYKGRKKETETKLTATMENISRLDDIIYELNAQLVPLKAQRDVALKYQGLDQQYNELELSVVVAQISESKAIYDQKAKTQAEKSAEKLASDQLINQINTKITSLKNKRQKVELQRDDMQAEIVNLTKLEADYEGKIKLFDNQKNLEEKNRAEILERINQLQIDREDNNKELGITEDKIRKLEDNLETLNLDIHNIIKEEEKFSASPRQIIDNMRQEFLNLVNEESGLFNQLNSNKLELASLKEKNQEKTASLKNLDKKHKKYVTDSKEAKKAYEVAKESLENLLVEHERLETDKSNLENTYTYAQKQMFKKLDQVKNSQAKLASLENIQASHSNFYQGVKAILNNSNQISGVIGAVADLITFDSKYSEAMEVALGAGAQNIIVQDEKSAKEAISYLRANRLGRATFLPITTVKRRQLAEYQLESLAQQQGFIDIAINLVDFDDDLYNPLSSLLATTVIVDTIDNANNLARKMGYSLRIVTLDGSLLMPGGSYSGGSSRKNNSSFIKVEIEELKSKLLTEEKAYLEAEKELKNLKTDLQAKLDELEVLKTKGGEARFDLQALELKFKQTELELEDFNLQVELLQTSDDLEGLEILEAENKELTVKLEKIAQEKISLEENLKEIQENQEGLEKLQADLQNKRQTKSLEASELKSELKFSQLELTRLKDRTEKIADQLEVLNLSQSSNLEGSEDREQMAEKLKDVSKRLESKQQTFISLKFELEDLIAQLEEQDISAERERLLGQKLAEELTYLSLGLEQEEKYLKERQMILIDKYHLSFKEASIKAQEVENLELAELSLKNLKTDIRNLGPVNIDSIGQYAEVAERYDFLSSQKTDLLDAKSMLESTIGQMDSEVEKRFKDTFEAIRLSFVTTFKQMFRGGDANLELTSDNLLEAGVEIIVQPPGKKLASLNLMSGGEKSLTALALLFAILKVRTVPFVVLDEVEAALDEANVKRFGDYMTNSDLASQFIVVTHRKGTMASADSLYGITMQEAGVSKLISVKLKEAENFLKSEDRK